MDKEKKENQGFTGFGEIFAQKEVQKTKPPAHEFQDLALRIIKELDVPNFKRGSVFKICKEQPKNLVINALNDTKELCEHGDKWKYFFKVIASLKSK
jgi:hypothetical protein